MNAPRQLSQNRSDSNTASLSSRINAHSSSVLPVVTKKLQSSLSGSRTGDHNHHFNNNPSSFQSSKYFKLEHSVPTPPPSYCPDSYQNDFNIKSVTISSSGSDKQKIEMTDVDADGSLDEDYQEPVDDLVLDEQEDLSIVFQKPNVNPTCQKKTLVIASSSPEKFYQQKNKNNGTQHKRKRRVMAIESSEEEQEEEEEEEEEETEREDDDIEVLNRQPQQIKLRNKVISLKATAKQKTEEEEEDEDDDVLVVSNKNKSSRSKQDPRRQSISSGSDHLPIKKKLKRRMAPDPDSDESDEEWTQHRSDRDEDDQSNLISEEEALHFFNTCDIAELPAVTACTLEQAQVIATLRPFSDPIDLKNKLRKKKGISSNILAQYQDIMKGYIEVDRVLTKCEKHGVELSEIMNIWAGNRSIADTEEGAIDLVNLNQNRSDHPAFKHYLYQQPQSIPSGIELKSYQLLGLNWLNLLYSKKISCILADEMGLGKTAQVISFLSHLKMTRAPRPHLIIVPASTLENWIREFERFSKNLIVRAYYGSQSERSELRWELKSSEDLDVVITTYNLASGSNEDRKFLEKMRFESCVYDEGHQLKNSESKRYKDLMRMKVNWRLLLTGTPLQNNLQELVSLLSFILPKIFENAKEDLRTIFKVRSDSQVNLLAQTRITRAKKMMTPFVLRRKKNQVLKELPKKIESVMYCKMEPKQEEMYKEILKRSKKNLMALENGTMINEDEEEEEEEEEDFNRNNGLLGGKKEVKEKNLLKEQKKKTQRGNPNKKVLQNTSVNVLMELRKAANHPMLFRRLYDDLKISKMAKACLNELEFYDRDVGLIMEDMDIMNDFELHLFSEQYQHLNQFKLKNQEWMESSKIKSLKGILNQKKQEGSRVLIFSQFTQMLGILEIVLKTMKLKYLILTGSTNVNERQGLVDEFSRDESITVFLLSTRAGGLGLNLMAADTVIIFDQDYNPHNDRQAEDRAYRLGQKRDVKVIKLITKDTIEEDILQLATNKIALDTSISELEPNQQQQQQEINNNNSNGNEKAIKNSLMATLRKRMMET